MADSTAWLEPALEAAHDDQIRADLADNAEGWQGPLEPMAGSAGACVEEMLNAEAIEGPAAAHVRRMLRQHLRAAIALAGAVADSEPLDVGCDEFLLVGVLDVIMAAVVQPAVPTFARQ